jgi:hypothetical protein
VGSLVNFGNIQRTQTTGFLMTINHISLSYTELQIRHPEITEGATYLNETMQFIYFPDNAFFDNDLEIDNLDDYDGIFVAGDLKVNGILANYESDYGAILIVLGDVYADTLIAGGSLIDIKHNAYIKNLCLTHYNHGCLSINKLYCTVLISEQLGDSIKDHSQVEYVFDDSYYSPLEDNEYYLSELDEIFKEKQWVEYDEDDIGETGYFWECSEYSFSADKFIDQEIIKGNNIESIINNIKITLTKNKHNEKNILANKLSDTSQLYKTIFRKFYREMDYQSIGLKRDTKIRVYNNDLSLDGDLVLDSNTFDKDNISAIYVDGNLKVGGTIYNTIETEGVQLFVSGSVHCHNLIVSASQIYINKTLTVENILYCTHPNKIDYDPKLKASKINSAKLAIIEHSYELKHILGNNLNHKVYTVSKDKKGEHFVIDQLKNILNEKYWSIEDECLEENRLYQDIILNKDILKSDVESKTTSMLKKRKLRNHKNENLKESIIDMIQCIKSFLKSHSLDYQDEDNRLKITGKEISFSIYYRDTSHSLSIGFCDRRYGKKKLYKFKQDLIFYIEKYLLNQIRTFDYVKNGKYLGSVLEVFQDSDWVLALDDMNYYPKLLKVKNTVVTTNTSYFNLNEDVILQFINTLNK